MSNWGYSGGSLAAFTNRGHAQPCRVAPPPGSSVLASDLAPSQRSATFVQVNRFRLANPPWLQVSTARASRGGINAARSGNSSRLRVSSVSLWGPEPVAQPFSYSRGLLAQIGEVQVQHETKTVDKDDAAARAPASTSALPGYFINTKNL